MLKVVYGVCNIYIYTYMYVDTSLYELKLDKLSEILGRNFRIDQLLGLGHLFLTRTTNTWDPYMESPQKWEFITIKSRGCLFFSAF